MPLTDEDRAIIERLKAQQNNNADDTQLSSEDDAFLTPPMTPSPCSSPSSTVQSEASEGQDTVLSTCSCDCLPPFLLAYLPLCLTVSFTLSAENVTLTLLGMREGFVTPAASSTSIYNVDNILCPQLSLSLGQVNFRFHSLKTAATIIKLDAESVSVTERHLSPESVQNGNFEKVIRFYYQQLCFRLMVAISYLARDVYSRTTFFVHSRT